MPEKVELLAPAGSMEALVAAVENGADAVYLGGKMFNARQYANNFDDNALQEAIEYCHLRGVKIYVTVNTLIKNKELNDVAQYIYKLQSFGVDAVIIQDIGLLYMIRKLFPQLEVHGSTQMAVHNLAGAQFLFSSGVKRVVLAREAELKDIKHIRQFSDIELEVFVHGALCISYSGQCLMSSMIGGRSGNRGRCAQPCRMKYYLTDLEGNELLQHSEIGEYLLSPRDLSTIRHIPELVKSGVHSFKFEGRMKRPEYVATVIRIYRNALDRYYKNPDNYRVLEEEERELAQIFNRDFTAGHILSISGIDLMSYKKPNNRGLYLGRIKENLHRDLAPILLETDLAVGDGLEFWVTKGGRKGSTVDKIILDNRNVESAKSGSYVYIKVPPGVKKGDRVFKTHDEKLIAKAQESYTSPSKRRILLHAKVEAEIGKPLSLTFTDTTGNQVTVQTDFITEKAIKKPLTDELLQKQLGRLGNTPFKLESLQFIVNADVMVPMSELNKARRLAVDKMEKIILQQQLPPRVEKGIFIKEKQNLFQSIPNDKKVQKTVLIAHVGDYQSFQAAVNTEIDEIYLMGDTFRNRELSDKQLESAIYKAKEVNKKIVISLPRFWFIKEKKSFYKLMERLVKLKPHGVLVGNLGTLEAVKQYTRELDIYGDYWLNVFNDFAVQKLFDCGITKITLSPELNLDEIADIKSRVPLECIVHGSIPLMTSRYCAIGATMGGKSTARACTGPCLKIKAGLKDRLNFIFPIETDRHCRMYIFNSKELCLIENLQDIISAGIPNLRLELQREPSQRITKLIQLYSEVLQQPENINKISSRLKEMYPKGTTKGHYFRGVE